MQSDETRAFPAALAAALADEFPYLDGDGVDLEAFDAFLSAEETTDWLRSWTGNEELTGDVFRVFAQDGTGGYAALWLVREGREVAEQPVVFLGSEGETAVVARDLPDFLWLLAAGLGPAELTLGLRDPEDVRPDALRTAVAERHAPDRRRPAAELVADAAREFPGFAGTVEEWCR
ncbi:SMI1/KNR4 family protein [Kitasatospora sp. NPDC088134]|uniref:SMI1/KNR4 family protein n=1 Tax=Kitasatospora sp. NPDC088134 TaxID=3364071 RepID=UPI0037F4E7E4